jgi:flagellar biosynthesis protein FliR
MATYEAVREVLVGLLAGISVYLVFAALIWGASG